MEKNVVAVCGNEARIYGPKNEKTNVRPFISKKVFTNYGQAREFATNYETPKSK